jgi:hypothetical protein
MHKQEIPCTIKKHKIHFSAAIYPPGAVPPLAVLSLMLSAEQ